MKNKIKYLMILLILLLFPSQFNNKVSAEEYEKNILISCESKEIDINDIPENREVELNVSIENCPGIFSLGLLVKYDMRLKLEEYVSCYMLDENDEQLYQIASGFTEGREGYMEIRVDSRNGIIKKFEGDFFKIIIRIPSDAKVGDEYKFDFKLRDDIDHFYILPNTSEIYHDDYFVEPIDGSIKIVGTPVESPEVNDVSESSEETNQTEPEISHETEKAITEAPKEPAEDTITKVTESTTVVTTNLTEQTSKTSVPEIMVITSNETSSSTEAITSEESTSQNSISVTEKTEHDEVNKRLYIIPIALSAMIIAAVSVISAKRKKHK